MIMPPPDISCFMPCDFAPGLSFPYPSKRLITPQTPTPAPIAVTTVFNPVTAVVKNAILLFPLSFFICTFGLFVQRLVCLFHIQLSFNFLSRSFVNCFPYSVVFDFWTFCPEVYALISPTSSTSSTVSLFLILAWFRFLTYFSMSNVFFSS